MASSCVCIPNQVLDAWWRLLFAAFWSSLQLLFFFERSICFQSCFQLRLFSPSVDEHSQNSSPLSRLCVFSYINDDVVRVSLYNPQRRRRLPFVVVCRLLSIPPPDESIWWRLLHSLSTTNSYIEKEDLDFHLSPYGYVRSARCKFYTWRLFEPPCFGRWHVCRWTKWSHFPVPWSLRIYFSTDGKEKMLIRNSGFVSTLSLGSLVPFALNSLIKFIAQIESLESTQQMQ